MALIHTADADGKTQTPVSGAMFARTQATRRYDWDEAQSVEVGDTSTQSDEFAASEVMLVADTDCYLMVGDDPEATDADMFLAAGTPFHLQVDPEQVAAVIRKAEDGALFILPVA